MVAYLAKTQAEFEAAVMRANKLNLNEGVLAGPRLLTDKDVHSG